MTFMCEEYVGAEVYLLDADGRAIEEPVTDKNALHPGLEVSVPTLFGYWRMRIEETEPSKELYAENADAVAVLEFDKDNRACWTSSMTINKSAMRMAKGFV